MYELLLPTALASGLGFIFNRKRVAGKMRALLTPGQRWSIERAKAWQAGQPWRSGANFIPSTAINQLEMWQADTFDPATIDRELGWAAGLGFNTLRVYLHHTAWEQDPRGFLDRVDRYLTLAKGHGIQTILVFFDDCWVRTHEAGPQPAPKAGVHNSGWLQDPGDPVSSDPALFAGLQPYVHAVMNRFRDDARVLMWDLYNEPGNGGEGNASLPLLHSVFAWARAVNPSQPLTSGIWNWDLHDLNTFQIQHSDVITYHDYETPDWHQRIIEMLLMHGRPMICTEYMARTRDCRFENTMPLLKRLNVGAISWGLVDGKTNTKYAWDTPLHCGSEPEEWFHEIFHADGTPYREAEVAVIRQLNGLEKEGADLHLRHSRSYETAYAIG